MKQPEILRTAHGAGAGALIRAESPPLDEIPPPTEIVVGSRGRPFEKGNNAAKNKKPALCLLGEDSGSNNPRLRSAKRKANAYRRRRCSELAAQHGGYLSAGASGMVAASARDLANAQLTQELADEAFERGDHDVATKLWGQAARLSDQSRQKELTAIALAAREAEARAKDVGWVDHDVATKLWGQAARLSDPFLTPDELEAARRQGLVR